MKKWLFMAGAILPALALATPINGGGSAGTASASDITLGGIAASQLVYSAGINPQQGKTGNSTGFSTSYTGIGTDSWSGFGKFSGAGTEDSGTLQGVDLTMKFSLTDNRHGTWSITNGSTENDLLLDLVFAMHTGGGSGAWLFDDYRLQGNGKTEGTWSLNLLNHGGELSDYSNLTLFVRDATTSKMVSTQVTKDDTPKTDVPVKELLDELADRNEQINPGGPANGGIGNGQQAGGTAADVPEPGSIALFGLAGLIGATVWRRKRPAVAARA